MEIEKSKENPFQVNRFQVDEMHNINIVEWNKKRKLQCYPLDLLRPKHRCRVGSSSSEHDSTFDENQTTFLDNRSESESAKDSNSFFEDSDTSMSVNEEAKLEEDSANTYLYAPTLPIEDVSGVRYVSYQTPTPRLQLLIFQIKTVNRLSYSEEETFVDSKYNAMNPSYEDHDTQAYENPDDHLLGLGSFSGHVYSEFVKDSSDPSVDKEFEDFAVSNGVNADVFVLSSGRLDVEQEVDSSTRSPTIDQEFEQYFSALML